MEEMILVQRQGDCDRLVSFEAIPALRRDKKVYGLYIQPVEWMAWSTTANLMAGGQGGRWVKAGVARPLPVDAEMS